jgi:hypothetical protein
MSIRIVSSNGLFKYRKKYSSYTKGSEFLGHMNCCGLLRDNFRTGGCLVTSSKLAGNKMAAMQILLNRKRSVYQNYTINVLS